ncbi:MAG: alpha/beta hydrolase [Candidatus Binataceae bacterium]|nr:alpha/beta hydrolase [Candidatus Binataceae bacterium]
MNLDPQMKAILDQLAGAGAKSFNSMTPAEAREGIRLLVQVFAGTPDEVAKVEDRRISGPTGEIPVRIYTPAGAAPKGALVYFHGGGWVIGDIATHDDLCRSLAKGGGCVVVSVDYRLAPEHKFPAAPDDCYAATKWVAANAAALGVDAQRIAVGGDSAGGNLAAVVAQMARDKGGPAIAFQLLYYPATDWSKESASQREFTQDGYILSRGDMVWFYDHYMVSDKDRTNPYFSPACAKSLAGLPPALVLTASIDPLRDEGEAYAEALKRAGVAVKAERYDGVCHGFLMMAGKLDAAKRAIAQSCAELRRVVGS